MSLIAQPSGLIPAYHPTGEIRSIAHIGILLPGTNVTILKGQAVFMARGTGAVVNGVTIPAGQMYLAPFNIASVGNAGSALTTQSLVDAQAILGVFAGVEYFDVTGFPQESNFWPAGQLTFPGTTTVVFLWQDPLIEYTIQTDSALTVATIIGDGFSRFSTSQASMSLANMANGSAITGLGQATMLGGSANNTAGSNRAFQITKTDPTVLNITPADPFLQFQVRIANPQTGGKLPAST